MTPQEVNDMIKGLRAGEQVVCKKCSKGVYVPVGADCKVTPCFRCDKCKSMINVN